MSKNFIRRQDVPAQLFGEDYARIRNPEGVFPAEDIIPMAKKLTSVNDVQAVVCDMDGTTTTTENLCIHSLEFMIRKISGKMESSEWAGLNSDRDYPNIIGNSTTRHVEYLIETY